MILDKEQKKIANAILKDIAKKQLVTLGGYAGVGKSVVVKFLSDQLKNYKVAAFTGKASNVLRKKGLNASTIHSLIYIPEDIGNDEVAFRLKKHHELEECDGFIIDEASMVSQELFDDLCSFGYPIILVGDHGQLEPVGGSKANLMANPEYRLEKIHRSAGELAHFAEWIRLGKRPADFPSKDAVKVIKKFHLTPNKRMAVDQIICGYNNTRVVENNMIRRALGRKAVVEVGEKVMCLKNNRLKGLFNGMQGVVTRVYDTPHFDLDANGFRFYHLNYLPQLFGKKDLKFEYIKDGPEPFEYAYCITCHKCVHPETLVETSEGLMPIKHIPDEGIIATHCGARPYYGKVMNGISPVMTIVTKNGYNITVTPDHKVEVWDGELGYVMKEAREVKFNEYVRLKTGFQFNPTRQVQMHTPTAGDVREKIYKTPEFLTPELAEFLGLFVADGTLFDTGFRLVKRHADVISRFSDLCVQLFDCNPRRINILGTDGCEVSSTYLSRWLQNIDGLLPNNKDVPLCVLMSGNNVQSKFLKGLFEDGFVNVKEDGVVDHIGFYSCQPLLITKIRTMLLRFGIVCGVTKNVKDAIYIYGQSCQIFRNHIGFVSQFKNDRLNKINCDNRYSRIPITKSELNELRSVGVRFSKSDLCNARNRGFLNRGKYAQYVPCDHHLRDRLNYHHDLVKSITNSFSKSMCVTVPETHRFLQNGFPFGNSQGDEWNNVLVIEERLKGEHLRWAYTAASRARESLIWVEAPPPRQYGESSSEWF